MVRAARLFRSMLGEPFFAWMERPAAAPTYEGLLVTFLDGEFASLLPAEAVEVQEDGPDERAKVHHGSPGEGELLEDGTGHVAVGSVRLKAWSRSGFDADAKDRFRTAVMLLSAHLRRLCNELYDRRVRERLYLARSNAQWAIFVVHGRRVLPHNPTAVAYCENHWHPDKTEHQLTEVQAAGFWETIKASWRNPVDPKWVQIALDVGGGVVDTSAIGRPDGAAFLLFSPPPREATSTGTPMLTKRQQDIMEWISEGKTSSEAAIILGISPRTVEKHLESIFQRFGVENRVSAVRTYLELKGH